MYNRISLAVLFISLYAVSGTEELTDTESTNDESYSRVRRGGFSMLRLGRGLQMLRLGKRALPMLRMGRSSTESLSDDDIQYLLNLMRKGRQVPLPRYGKDLAFQYMLMNALKNAELNSDYDDEIDSRFGFGYDLEPSTERQIRPAPRPGYRYKRSTDNIPAGSDESSYVGGDQAYENIPIESEEEYMSKRVAPLMRYGKLIDYIPEDETDVDKRAMRMLRLGRGMRMLRLGKRPMSSDLSDDETMEADKRALRLLRLGKRPRFAMLRMGRGDIEEEKRALRLLRLGKKSETDES